MTATASGLWIPHFRVYVGGIVASIRGKVNWSGRIM